MKHIIILEESEQLHQSMLPLTFTRPVADLLVGAMTLRQRWERLLPGEYHYKTPAPYLAELFPSEQPRPGDLVINSAVVPSPALANAIAALPPCTHLNDADGNWIAHRHSVDQTIFINTWPGRVTYIKRPYDLFLNNGATIRQDYPLITAGRTSRRLPADCTLIGPADQLFIDEDATVCGATFNTTTGPIFIDRFAKVSEGACLRGPLAVLEGATVNMCARISDGTTIGAECKVGGEIANVVMHNDSNKAHDGFLGNAVIGSWCNLGAGCVSSNLKNDYTEIKLWDYTSRRFARTGLQFCGLIMADHSKAGINTTFNTATVVGVGCNIHGTGFPRNFIESFSDGGPVAGFKKMPLEKFLDIARRVMDRRDTRLTGALMRMYTTLYDLS